MTDATIRCYSGSARVPTTRAIRSIPRQQDNVSSNLHLTGVPQATVQQNLDGGTNDAGANGWSASNVPLDTISEFKVVLNAYDASYGRAGGGALDALLKTGTNAIHGSLYEFARRPWLDASKLRIQLREEPAGTNCPFPDPTQARSVRPGSRRTGVHSPPLQRQGTRPSSLLNGSRLMRTCPGPPPTSLRFPTRNGLREISPALSTSTP